MKVLLLLALLGVATYLAVRAVQRASGRASGGGRTPSLPVAPDDDPDFLRELDRRRRRARRPEETGEPQDESDA